MPRPQPELVIPHRTLPPPQPRTAKALAALAVLAATSAAGVAPAAALSTPCGWLVADSAIAAPSPAPSASPAPATPSTAAATAAAASTAADDSYLPPPVEPPARDPVGTRLIDIATPYTVGSNWLELLVTHRFIQPFNRGGSSHNLWGLDSGADVGIGFTYGLLQHLDLSVYRGEFQQDFELAAKYQLFQQGAGMPLSFAVRAGADMLEQTGVQDPHRPFLQLLFGRRFAPGWNLFVSPSFVHATPLLRDAYNVPVGATAPLPGHWLIEAEGIAANRALAAAPGAGRFAWHVAFTKPLGWHVFQILIGNSRATTVDQIVGGDFGGGYGEEDLRLGFNLIRYFNL